MTVLVCAARLTMKISLPDLMLGRCIAQFRIAMSYVKMNIVEVEVAV